MDGRRDGDGGRRLLMANEALRFSQVQEMVAATVTHVYMMQRRNQRKTGI